MIIRTIDPVVIYCMQICMHVQFSWGGIVTACLYCGVRERKGLLCVHREIVNSVRIIYIASQRNAKFVENVSVTIGESNIKSSSCVKRNLDASLDSKLNMEKQVNVISRSCFAQLCQINHIIKYLTAEATTSLVNSRVTSRLDYCSFLLIGVAKTVLNKLQNAKNIAARLVTRTS